MSVFLTCCQNCFLKLLLCPFDFIEGRHKITSYITFQKGFKDLDLYMGHGCLGTSTLIHGFAEEQ